MVIIGCKDILIMKQQMLNPETGQKHEKA